MKKLALLLLFLLPLATASQAVYLYLGQTIEVNEIPVELIDISKTGDRAAIKIGNDTYVLSFGENVTYGDITVYMGSIELSEKRVKLLIEGVKNIESSSELSIEVPYPTKIVLPGDKVSFTLMITNEGDDALLPLSYAVPRGFEAYFYAENSKVSEVYLKHGETKMITFIVKVPEDAKGDYKLYAFVGNVSAEIRLSVESGEKYEAYAEYLGKEVEAGETVTFPITIKANSDSVISLSASVPENWSAYFQVGTEKVTKLYLPAETVKSVTLVIEVPSNAPVGTHEVKAKVGDEEIAFEVYVSETHVGENGVITLRVTDSSSGAYIPSALVEVVSRNETVAKVYTTPDGRAQIEVPEDSYTIKVTKEGYESYEESVDIKAGETVDLGIISLEKIPYYFTVECSEPSKSAVLGESLQYKVEIENLGSQDDSYALSVKDLPDNWAYRIVEDLKSKVGISETFVKAGSKKTLYVVVIPPNNAQLGTYNFSLEVQSKGNKETKKLSLEANLIGSYDMSIDLEKYSFTMKAGETKEISIWVYNSGSSPLTSVQLEVNAPEGWLVSVTPESVASVEPDKYVEFKVSITSPQNIDAGDYKITVKANSDQLTKQEDIRITVKTSNSTTYLGIGIILGSLMILGLVLKKYGRK
ncbi:PEGA domain-containing protein [Thermococcus sp. M39]|uniref:COG1470 family protein n=1 Tax=unclassified Thermococcus TaxID=2627626 RepID=UPI00143C5502|nr:MULTISPECIES: NEW3 domain-containing protein [unclassified Thermococcus]NJE07333.1 PEGA domain-containing protein [Thermococcus sp. M39]NJE12536.1 PEGA domain-containing protein [Thermococcus sp. LS2]